MTLLRVDGLEIYYELHGSDYGRTIALIHHDGLTCDVWRPLLPHLAQNYRVLLFDRPGHGRSSVPPIDPPMTVERAASLLDRMFTLLGIDDIILFGASGGALIALEFALQHPGRVPLLIFGEPPLHGLSRDFAIDRCGYSAARFQEIFDQDGMEAVVRSFLGTMFASSRVNQILRSAGGRAMINLKPHVLLQALTTDELYSPGQRLRDIHCLTIVLTGENSSMLFKSVERVLSSQIPYCMPIRLPRADHASLLSPTPHLLRALSAIATTSAGDTGFASSEASTASTGLTHLANNVQRLRSNDFAVPISISFTQPLSNDLVKRDVVDISYHGVAFQMQPEDYFVPGLILARFGLELPHTTILGRGIIRRVRLGRGVAGLEITSISQKDRAILASFVEEVGRTTIAASVVSELPKLASVLEVTGAIDPAHSPPPHRVAAYCRLRVRALKGGSTIDAPVPTIDYVEEEDSDETSVASMRASHPPGTIPHIVIIGGARNAGKVLRIKEGMTIGRSLNNDIVLDEPGVSRSHAKLTIGRDGSIDIEDLGSTHGLGYRGARVKSVRLHDGDRVQIGDAAISLIRMDDPEPTSIRRLDTDTAGRGLKIHATDLVLLSARSGTELDGTAEIIREHETTWFLHHVGVMPSSRLALQELVAEALEVAATRPNLEYVRSLLRVEQNDALQTLLRMRMDKNSIVWREWVEIIEGTASSVVDMVLRPTTGGDAAAVESILAKALEPLEMAAVTTAVKTEGSDSVVIVATEGTRIMASASCRRGVEGMELGDPVWSVRVLPAEEPPRCTDAVGLLLNHVLSSELAREGVRVLVMPHVSSALAERGFVRGASWVEAVAMRVSASQLTNFWAVLM